MWSCDQSLVTLAFLLEKLLLPQFCKDLTKKASLFEGQSWFDFNYTSAAKGLKLKVRKFLGLIVTFVEVTEGKVVGRPFCSS